MAQKLVNDESRCRPDELGGFMLKVTPAASVRLAEMLVEVMAPEDGAVRFVVQDDACINMEPGIPGPHDTTFSHDGKIVLVLDEAAVDVTREMVLDVADDGDGRRLSLKRRPQSGGASADGG